MAAWTKPFADGAKGTTGHPGTPHPTWTHPTDGLSIKRGRRWPRESGLSPASVRWGKRTDFPISQHETGKKDGLNLGGGGVTVLPGQGLSLHGVTAELASPSRCLPPSLCLYLHPGASAHLGPPAGQRHPARLAPAWPARRGAADAGDAGTMRSLPPEPEPRRIASPAGAHAGTHGCAQSPAGCRGGSQEGEGERGKKKKRLIV